MKDTMHYKEIKTILQKLAKESSNKEVRFFKIGPGDYAEHDRFIGVGVLALKNLAKVFQSISMLELQSLITSPVNEERLLALFILIKQYKQGNEQVKESIYKFYIEHLKHINNWNLVDSSAHYIMGDYLHHKNKTILVSLAKSSIIWGRRVAIIATWYFIRQGEFDWTIKIAEILLEDSHDLLHKAVGWMLREVGKRDVKILQEFLNKHAKIMPRTMLRYAIEKFPTSERKVYLMMGR